MKAIDQVGDAYSTLKDARRAKMKLARLRIEKEMAQLALEFDALVLRASEGGASVSTLAREMGASRTTVYQIIERAKGVAPTSETLLDPLNNRYTLMEGGVRVTLPASDLEEYAVRAGWNAEGFHRVPGLMVGEFSVEEANGRAILVPLVDFMPEHGKRHPVTLWADVAENEAEALAWYAARQTEAVAA